MKYELKSLLLISLRKILAKYTRNHYTSLTFHKLATKLNMKDLSKTQRRYAKAKRGYRFGAAFSNIFACAASIVKGNNQKIYLKKSRFLY